MPAKLKFKLCSYNKCRKVLHGPYAYSRKFCDSTCRDHHHKTLSRKNGGTWDIERAREVLSQSWKGASDCGKYRYRLHRFLNKENGIRLLIDGRVGSVTTCLFIMLNPSTADGETDDPTIRRCMGYASKWRYDMLDVVNLFSYRSTDSKVLINPSFDCWGPEHWEYFMASVAMADLVVCGWGSHPWAQDVAKDAIRRIKELGKTPLCLKKNANGSPAHPLYLKGDLLPIPLDSEG